MLWLPELQQVQRVRAQVQVQQAQPPEPVQMPELVLLQPERVQVL